MTTCGWWRPCRSDWPLSRWLTDAPEGPGRRPHGPRGGQAEGEGEQGGVGTRPGVSGHRCLPAGGTASWAPACLPQTCVPALSVDRCPELPPALPLSSFKPSARAAAPASCSCRDTGWEDAGRPWGCREDVLLEAWGRALRGRHHVGAGGVCYISTGSLQHTGHLGPVWVGSSSTVGVALGWGALRAALPCSPSTRRYPPAGLSPANGEPAPGCRTGLLSISSIYHVPVCAGHVGRGAPLSQSAWFQGGGGRYNPCGRCPVGKCVRASQT